MNAYGQRAMNHWRTHLPHRYATISDPQTFFTDLGEQVADQVSDLAASLQAQLTLSENYLTRVGQLNMCRLRAEEVVLAEMVLLPAETEQQDEPAQMWSPDDPRIDPTGMPTDRTHPLWGDLEDDSVTPQMFRQRAAAWRAQIRTTRPPAT